MLSEEKGNFISLEKDKTMECSLWEDIIMADFIMEKPKVMS